VRTPTVLLLVAVVTATSACSAGDGNDVAPDPVPPASDDVDADPPLDEPDDQAEAAATQDPASDLPFESGDGWFEVDGERYEAEWVVRCLPRHLDIEQPHEDDLELLAYAGGQTHFGLDLSHQEIFLTPDDDRNYTALYAHPSLSRDGEGGVERFGDTGFATGPDGAWYDLGSASPLQLALGNEGASPLPEPAATVQGQRVTGTAAGLLQNWPEEAAGTTTVTYDLSIPGEEFDCDEL
jgi:hypothetical protein